ncbi:hypothetical protein HZC35_04920 [Candidatus Saganbacteria bacterium]|nr:hypothetical protein [Candidatus Saganbacteria bacterium]
MSFDVNGSSFSVERNVRRGLRHHYVLKPKVKEPGVLSNLALIGDLKENVLPALRRQHGQGFRMVVEHPLPQVAPEIHLLAGVGIARVNPQEWRTPVRQARYTLYDAIDANILYQKGGVYGVGALDPKSSIHFYVMTLRPFAHLLEAPLDMWVELFQGAERIIKTLNHAAQYVRYTVEVGDGFQQFPGAGLQVQGGVNSLPSFLPQDYGFEVNQEGVIEAPDGSQPHQELIITIEKRRSSVNCSCREATGSLDEAILRGLTRLLLKEPFSPPFSFR